MEPVDPVEPVLDPAEPADPVEAVPDPVSEAALAVTAQLTADFNALVEAAFYANAEYDSMNASEKLAFETYMA